MQHFLATAIWRAGLFVEAVILVRGMRTRMHRKYPIFYIYIACVFLVSIALYVVFTSGNDAAYNALYWPTQLITLVVGYGVILDILEQALASYPGAERFARFIGLAIFFVTFCWVGAHIVAGPQWSLNKAADHLETYLRVVEALFLATILIAVSYYRIAIGRNLKGLILGLGTYVAVSLVTLALYAFIGAKFEFAWETFQSSAYLFALCVWTVAFWSYAPNPAPTAKTSTELDGNYEALAGQTRARLEELSYQFNRTAGS